MKEEDAAASHFSREGMHTSMAPNIEKEATPPEFPNKELEIDFSLKIEKIGIRKEAIVTYECSDRIELMFASALTLEE